jgi:hypothetical protein
VTAHACQVLRGVCLCVGWGEGGGSNRLNNYDFVADAGLGEGRRDRGQDSMSLCFSGTRLLREECVRVCCV